jgi:hypothetical protein
MNLLQLKLLNTMKRGLRPASVQHLHAKMDAERRAEATRLIAELMNMHALPRLENEVVNQILDFKYPGVVPK